MHLATIFLRLVATRRPEDIFNFEPCAGMKSDDDDDDDDDDDNDNDNIFECAHDYHTGSQNISHCQQ